MIAPQADPCDGLIEYVRWGPIGRLRLAVDFSAAFHRHAHRPSAGLARSRRTRRIRARRPVNVMVDGEILRLHCHSLEILPGALDVIV